MNPKEEEKISWTALEYEEKIRTEDWFWALGIIIVASSVAAIIFNNYFFAALIIISGLLLGFLAIKKPELIPHEIGPKGLKIKNRIYLYENIKAFWVSEEPTPILFIKSERLFLPVISMPTEEQLVTKIRNAFISKGIPQEEMKLHLSEKMIESLGF